MGSLSLWGVYERMWAREALEKNKNRAITLETKEEKMRLANGKEISSTEMTSYLASLQSNVTPSFVSDLSADLKSKTGYSIESLGSYGFSGKLIAKVLQFAYVDRKNTPFLKQYIEAFKEPTKLGTKRGPYMTKARIKAAKAAARKAKRLARK